MRYTIFGCNNASSAYFLQLIEGSQIEVWGRNEPLLEDVTFIQCDLSMQPQQSLNNIKGLLISFAPIWLLAEFLVRISVDQPEKLVELTGIVAVSSSSYITKQYAFSEYDKGLAASLNLVYGSINGFSDRNISSIVKLLRRAPLLFLPRNSGLRQPIHASQLADVVYGKVKSIQHPINRIESTVLTVGGDEILTYTQMILKVQMSLPVRDVGRRCRIIELPNRVFYLFAAGILPINPKLFEAIMRVTSNLAGFSLASQLLGVEPKTFPVLPLSL
jgi:hypothetical protein